MRSGRLRKRLRLQKPVPTTDAEGNVAENWTDVGGVWVEIDVPSVLAATAGTGREEFSQGQMVQRRPHLIVTRYRKDLASLGPNPPAGHNMRFLLDSTRALEIQTVNDLGELHRELRILATEKVI